MPATALETLTRLHVQYPMLFKLTNTVANRVTHCGVLEFVADEGRIYVPYWMMRNLLLEEGGIVNVENISLPVANFAKFQPQAPDFLDIHNPKAVLENALRNFACLTTGDMIAIKYNKKIYELCVLELQPKTAVSIIECDMRVDFAAPVGYKEPERKFINRGGSDQEADPVIPLPDEDIFRPFCGSGQRLDGKCIKAKDGDASSASSSPARPRGVPNYSYKPGLLNFIRRPIPKKNGDEEPEKKFVAFEGRGYKLKDDKNSRK